MPLDIPENIAKIDLAFNNITQLKPKEFVTIKDLKLLNLSSNGLEHIDTGDAAQQVTGPSSQDSLMRHWFEFMVFIMC